MTTREMALTFCTTHCLYDSDPIEAPCDTCIILSFSAYLDSLGGIKTE